MKAIQHIRGIRRFLRLAQARHGAPPPDRLHRPPGDAGRRLAADPRAARAARGHRAAVGPEEVAPPRELGRARRSTRGPRRSCATTTGRTTRSSPPASGCARRTAGAASRRTGGSRSRSRSAAEPWAPPRCPAATLRAARVLLGVAIAVSVVHYVDNFANWADYPHPPSGPDPSRAVIAGAWVVFTASALAGYVLLRRGHVTAAALCLALYSGSGLVGLGALHRRGRHGHALVAAGARDGRHPLRRRGAVLRRPARPPAARAGVTG